MKTTNSYAKASLLVGAAASMILLSAPLYAQSKMTHYSDVEAGAWYESAAKALLDIGALESDEALLRPNALATRAEMVKLLVRVNDETLVHPSTGSFTDVSRTAWYFPYFETAARAGWVRGDKDCYGTMPCYARPNGSLNRAEAAALLVRAFALASTGAAPTFMDNANRTTWFHQPIQTAADHCILQGDDISGLVRPASNMNRAEMVAMFHRAYQNLQYGRDCSSDESSAEISSAISLSTNRVRLVFSTDLDTSRADDAFRYSIASLGGTSVDIGSATVIGSRTVDLMLDEDLTGNLSYRVTASTMRTAGGIEFSASKTFTVQAFSPVIQTATVQSANRIRVAFNADVESSTANDAFRYTVREDASTTTTIGVQSAVIVDSKTVDLVLSGNLRAGVTYRVTANDIETTGGQTFTDDITANFSEVTANIVSVATVGTNTLRLTFNTGVDRVIAETTANYRVTSNGHDIGISNVRYINATTVEVTLSETLLTQRPYVVYGTNLRTTGGVQFTDSGSTVYANGNITLRASLVGAREVPPVITLMSGSGTFTLTETGVSYDITITGQGSGSGSTITGAHFHRGAIGVNGPIVHPITVTGTHFTGTWTNLSERDRNDLLNGNLYVNVHTQDYPNGAIRGQVTVNP